MKYMEKKTYVSPEMEAVEMDPATVIAVSKYDAMSNGIQFSKERDQDYDEDEEEFLIEEYLKDQQ